MEFAVIGWCTLMIKVHSSLNFRNLTSGDMEILLGMIQLRVTGLKKIRTVYFIDLLEGRGEKGQYDLVYVEQITFG